MTIGWQEILALLFVALVLCAALYRRWRKSRSSRNATGPAAGEQRASESTVHFYRRRD